ALDTGSVRQSVAAGRAPVRIRSWHRWRAPAATFTSFADWMMICRWHPLASRSAVAGATLPAAATRAQEAARSSERAVTEDSRFSARGPPRRWRTLRVVEDPDTKARYGPANEK